MANVRLALRGFVKAPVFTAVAVLSLARALAIGANTALFGLLDSSSCGCCRSSGRTSSSSSGWRAGASGRTPATASARSRTRFCPSTRREVSVYVFSDASLSESWNSAWRTDSIV